MITLINAALCCSPTGTWRDTFQFFFCMLDIWLGVVLYWVVPSWNGLVSIVLIPWVGVGVKDSSYCTNAVFRLIECDKTPIVSGATFPRCTVVFDVPWVVVSDYHAAYVPGLVFSHIKRPVVAGWKREVIKRVMVHHRLIASSKVKRSAPAALH